MRYHPRGGNGGGFLNQEGGLLLNKINRIFTIINMKKLTSIVVLFIVIGYIDTCFGVHPFRVVRDYSPSSIDKKFLPSLTVFNKQQVFDERIFKDAVEDIIYHVRYKTPQFLVSQTENVVGGMMSWMMPKYKMPEFGIQGIIENMVEAQVDIRNKFGLEVTKQMYETIVEKEKQRVAWIVKKVLISELSNKVTLELKKRNLVNNKFLEEFKKEVLKLNVDWVEDKVLIPNSHKNYIIRAVTDTNLIKNTFSNLFQQEKCNAIGMKVIPVSKSIKEHLDWNTYLVQLIAESDSKILFTPVLLKLQLRSKYQNPKYFTNLKHYLVEISKLESGYIPSPGAGVRIRKGKEDLFMFTQKTLASPVVHNLKDYKPEGVTITELQTKVITKLLQFWKDTIIDKPLQESGILIDPFPNTIKLFKDFNGDGEYGIKFTGIERTKKVTLIKVYRRLKALKYEPEAIKKAFEKVFWPGILNELAASD